MPQYQVIVPVCGYVSHNVEADTEESAIALALDEDFDITDVQDLNQYEKICEGNVILVEYSEAEATLNDDESDEDTQKSEVL